jgi:uncharacterized protein (TIGR02271 family)
MTSTTSGSSSIDWDDVTKREARGSNDEDLGEVQEVGQNYVLVQRGMVNKKKFYIPRDLAESYDGTVLRFRISEEDAETRFLRDSPPPRSSSTADERESSMSKRDKTIGGEAEAEETTVPLTEEKLNVSKRASTREATITKEPVTETKTVEVPVTHEEISVERRPVSSDTTTRTAAAERPVQSRTETKVPLKKEEVEVTKQPYVKEEVAVKKKPVTETRTVSDEVTSEKVKVKGAGGEGKVGEEEEDV